MIKKVFSKYRRIAISIVVLVVMITPLTSFGSFIANTEQYDTECDLKEFKIHDSRIGEDEYFIYEEGMTFKEWLGSPYNTGLGSCIALWVNCDANFLGANPYMYVTDQNGNCLDYANHIIGKDATSYTLVLDKTLETIETPPSLDHLQSKYKFEYYSTLNSAVADVNEGTIGENADSNKEAAVAGIYTDENGKPCLVLLDNVAMSTRVTPTTDVTINLGGYKLTCTDKIAIDSSSGSAATITVDGRLSGSTIEISGSGGTARPIQAKSGNTFNILGGTYIGISNGANASVMYAASGATLNVSDATVIATETTGTTRGFSINAGATANITNCTITAKTDSAKCYGVYNSGTTTISGCTIISDANYDVDNSTLSQGVLNYYNAELTINDCYVRGTHSGVQNAGTLNVNGGTYEGYGHGGFYFSGEGTVSYVKNATIRECDMSNGYTAITVDNNAGFYIGGNNNVTVYMDNCNIYGSKQSLVIRSSAGEQNNTLYISNSTVNLDSEVGVRVDSITHKLYIGTGCNFTANDTTLPEAVVETGETYR